MAGDGRSHPSGHSRALEDKPRALEHSGAQGELTQGQNEVEERLGRARDGGRRTASPCKVRRGLALYPNRPNEPPLEPLQLRVPSGASKMVS